MKALRATQYERAGCVPLDQRASADEETTNSTASCTAAEQTAGTHISYDRMKMTSISHLCTHTFA